MGEEKKDEGEGYPIKILLKEALRKKRNVKMDNFAQILQWFPTDNASTCNNHSRGATPFKVQVKFDIPIFEGKIDADAIYIWFNLLEGYFLFMIFTSGKRLISHLSKSSTTSRASGKPNSSRRTRGNPHYFQTHPLEICSGMPSRRSTTLSGAMRINT